VRVIASNFWSASANANNSDNAWNVNFNNGNANNNNKNNDFQVRLVQAGEWFCELHAGSGVWRLPRLSPPQAWYPQRTAL